MSTIDERKRERENERMAAIVVFSEKNDIQAWIKDEHRRQEREKRQSIDL